MRVDGPEPPCHTVTELSELLRRRVVSPVEVTEACLRRVDSLDRRLNSFVTVFAEQARAEARTAEAELSRGTWRGPLHGVPVGVKDLCAVAGAPNAAGTWVRRKVVAHEDATVVRRLRDAGAVILGALQLTEGALAEYHPAFAPVMSPFGDQWWPGASSSRSAVAVAAGFCFGAIGTDTGGSIRFPAAMNGIVGIKPTWGRVSRHGVFPLGMSLDHVGPLARTVADAAVMLGAIAGHDERDSTTLREPTPSLQDGPVRGLRVGIDRAYCTDLTSSDVVAAFDSAASALDRLGLELVDTTVPVNADVLEAWKLICAPETAIAHSVHFDDSSDEYGHALRGFIEIGRALRATDVSRAALTRAEFCGRMRSLFDDVDVLLTPVMALSPPTVAEAEHVLGRPELLPDWIRFSAPFNLSGSPTVTLPWATSHRGMPIAIQLVGAHLTEDVLCRVARRLERVRPSAVTSAIRRQRRP